MGLLTRFRIGTKIGEIEYYINNAYREIDLANQKHSQKRPRTEIVKCAGQINFWIENIFNALKSVRMEDYNKIINSKIKQYNTPISVGECISDLSNIAVEIEKDINIPMLTFLGSYGSPTFGICAVASSDLSYFSA